MVLPFSFATAQTSLEPAAITRVEGKAFVGDSAAARAMILSGDPVIHTDAGRIEVHLRGGALYLGENSSVRIFDSHPFNFNRLEMLRGSAVVETGRAFGLVVCEREVSLSDSGLFRFDVRRFVGLPGESDCHVRVYKGAASARLETVTSVLRTTQEMHINRKCGDMIPTQDFKVEDVDSLDRWSRHDPRSGEN